MLDGDHGAARQKALELMIRYAEVLGAERLCTISWADLFCGSHHYLEVAGSDDFDTVFSKMSLCSDSTVKLGSMAGNCICYSGVEPDCTEVPDQMLMDPDQKKINLDWLSRFVDAGVILSGNCIPYLTGFVPMAGEHFVSCESSAVLFINSVWGGRGNGDGIEASFSAAVCGRTPYWGKHRPENRRATIEVKIESAPSSIHDWDALGQALGSRLPAHSVPLLRGNFMRPNAIQLKAFFASLACAAGTELCHIESLTPEATDAVGTLKGNPPSNSLIIAPIDVADTIQSLNPNPHQKIDYISLGCPHYHIEEIRRIAVFLEGRHIHPDTIVHIWTAGSIKYLADRCGYTEVIQDAGAKILTGSCPSSRGYPAGVQTVAYDSAKQRKSAEQETDAKLFYGSRQQCLESAISGRWEGC